MADPTDQRRSSSDPAARGVTGWLRRNTPTREEVIGSRWLKPFAHRIGHSELWRFTRRSVPRGVALGLFVGIFLLIPGVQIIGVALLALPVRANIPVGAVMTFLSNPATTPFILGASVWVGDHAFGYHANVATMWQMMESGASLSAWLSWIWSDAAPALLGGLFVISALSALIGYFMAKVIWRLWIGQRWARKKQGAQLMREARQRGNIGS